MGTVVACSTPFGSSGIAVVRLTGNESHKITSLLLKSPSKKNKQNLTSLFSLIDTDWYVFDESVVNLIFGPNTNTDATSMMDSMTMNNLCIGDEP